jgi:alpha-L-fucosidase
LVEDDNFLNMKFNQAILCAFFISCIAGLAGATNQQPMVIAPFKPDWVSLTNYQCPEWFRDAKFGIWSHWGPQSVPEGGDWYARNMYVQGHPAYQLHMTKYGHPSKVGYKDVVEKWKAEMFDLAQADQLMQLYKDAGAKYFVSMGVHHDNFDLWNSKFHKWNAVNMGPRKDIVGIWAAAARKQGLRFGVSEHLERSYSWFNTNKRSDTNGPLVGVPYDGNDPKLADFYFPPHADESMTYPTNPPEWWMHQWRDRINDLVDSYHPDLLYTDGGIPFGEVGISTDGKLIVRSLAQGSVKIKSVALLGSGKVKWQQSGAGLIVTMPDKLPCSDALALQIKGVSLTPVK